jgi:hypothetical protein
MGVADPGCCSLPGAVLRDASSFPGEGPWLQGSSHLEIFF